jgi:predicted CopG family antitoxin
MIQEARKAQREKNCTIKLHKDVYDRLCQFQCKKETFSQAVDRLLKVWEGFHSLSQVVGGMHEYADWKEKQRLGVATPIVEAAHPEGGVKP